MKKKMVSNLNNKKYTNLTKKEIVLISLYQRGGNKKKIHSEEIGYKAFQINRELFSWKLKKFKNYPNLDITYKTLSHLKEDNNVYGGRHDDSNKDGWMLTDKGLMFCKNELSEFIDIKKNKSNPQQREKGYLNSIKKSSFYKEWKSGHKNLEERNIYDVADLLKVLTSNTPRLVEKFFETKTLAIEINENVYDFLRYLENKHKDIFNEERKKEALNKSKNILRKAL